MVKKFSYLSLIALCTSLSVQAMDMDKVNALAEQIKAGTVSQGISTATTVAKEEVKQVVEAPVVAVAEPKTVSKEIHNTEVASNTVVTEKSLGLRKTDLYTEESETKPEEGIYTTAAPGTSQKFERAYENAPPMIPHSTDGLLPITKGNNACLGCHMPEVAPSMKATPIPATHFTNYRPTTVYKGGELVKEGKIVGLKGALGNTSDIKLAKVKKLDHLYQGRYNCSQCHAPQAEIAPLVGNTFTPDFTSKDGKSSSHLIDAMNEGVE